MIGIKKLFEFRNQSAQKRGMWGDDQEKPFLDHLEDLRWMLLKVLITLLVAVVGCFAFHQQLFDIVLKPLRISAEFKSEVLPQRIDEPRWERFKLWTQTLGTLPDAHQRQIFLEEIEAKDAHFLQQKSTPRWSLNQDEEEEQPVAFDSLLRITSAYQAASVLYQEAGAKQKREKIPPPEDFFKRMLSAEEVAVAIELWKNGVRADPSPATNMLNMQALGPTEPFIMSMKMALYGAIVVSFPVLLFFLAEFILPGITQRERKVLYRALFVGFGLFIVGVLFAYFVVVPRALNFFQNWGSDLGLLEEYQIGKYVSFVTQMTLIFGLCFELPVVVLSLLKLGLVSVNMLREGRLWGYGIILVSAALITPTTDALTLALLAGPMIILYEITILIGAGMERKERKEAAAAEARYQERLLQPALATGSEAAASTTGKDSEEQALALPGGEESVPTPKPRTDIHSQEIPQQEAAKGENESSPGNEAPEEDENEEDPWLDDPWAEDEQSRQAPSAWNEDFRPEEDEDDDDLQEFDDSADDPK